jgi:hypothetical protein
MSGTIRDVTAGFSSSEGTFTPDNLFAGSAEVVTTTLPLAASTAIAARTVLALNTSGYLVAYDDTAVDSKATAVCISVEAAASSGSVREIPVYVGGCFNHEALVWPAGANTLAERRAAFQRTNIVIDKIPAVRS